MTRRQDWRLYLILSVTQLCCFFKSCNKDSVSVYLERLSFIKDMFDFKNWFPRQRGSVCLLCQYYKISIFITLSALFLSTTPLPPSLNPFQDSSLQQHAQVLLCWSFKEFTFEPSVVLIHDSRPKTCNARKNPNILFQDDVICRMINYTHTDMMMISELQRINDKPVKLSVHGLSFENCQKLNQMDG